ncbi:MAG: hypothetical protein D6705_04760 [Deltaproteobacteria bacterium]|nr:MAG: hypothetical protein D6705_04760 [Deltaproteobacteria bacterium]
MARVRSATAFERGRRNRSHGRAFLVRTEGPFPATLEAFVDVFVHSIGIAPVGRDHEAALVGALATSARIRRWRNLGDPPGAPCLASAVR